MERSLTRCNEHHRRAAKHLPLGVSSNYRFWGEGRTLYLSRARGPRVWDLDGNEYIDYRLGYGPTVLGYAHPEVDAAARKGMEVGGTSAISTELELEVARRIGAMVPAAQMVRFANSGTEAVMASLRLARAFTGRDSHVMVEGGFNGLFDAVLWRTSQRRVDGRMERVLVPESKGIPRLVAQLVHQVPLNDCEQLEDVFRRKGDQLAAFLIEPIQGNCCGIPATAEYLETVRKLCDRHGVVLIVDEVKTGFRVARGGAQELLGVKADLCTFAKALANGYPISAIAGREDIMRRLGPEVPQGGTYAAHPLSLAAAAKTLEIIAETDALERIAAYGRRLQSGMREILEQRDVPHAFVGHPSMAGLVFSPSAPRSLRDYEESDSELYNALAVRLNDLGILCEPDSMEPWFLSAAHDERCLQETLEKFEIALDETLEERRDLASLGTAVAG
jgi:glutamate-1-semialdehyde 2,1-aminomutase